MHLFPRAQVRRTKGAIKLHTLLDLRGSLPAFIAISQGKPAAVRVLGELVLEPGSFHVMERGSVDFKRLYGFVRASAFLITRAKTNLKFNRRESRPVNPATGVRSDPIVWWRKASSIQHCPDKLRRIHFVDPDTGRSRTFLTNNFALPAPLIALPYKSRWQVELFFKWIKQPLRIRHFYGTSDNAVKTQIWISICVYVLVVMVKKQLASTRSLYSILQILSVNAFEKVPLQQALRYFTSQNPEDDHCNQLIFNY